MFTKAINSTAFTCDAADRLFPNIADCAAPDKSYMSTLRALLRQRLPDGESVKVICKPLHYNAVELASVSASQAMNLFMVHVIRNPNRCQNEFTEMLKSLKMPDGKLCYNKSFVYDDCKAVVWLTEEAYRKTVALVSGFSDEVAWHGTVSRALNSDIEFIIDNIFVYPQEVTGSSVNTDREAYTQWLYGLDDEVFSTLRMQGHSHVNTGVSPSGVDGSHRTQILEQLEQDMFYIFMIWNKSLLVNTVVYDMSRNILYEDKDVDVKLINSKEMTAFMKDANAKVKKFGVRKSNKKHKLGGNRWRF